MGRRPQRKYPRPQRDRWPQPKQGTRRQVRNRLKANELIQAAKDGPCTDCGVPYPPWIMELDHVDPRSKVAAVSKLKFDGLPPAVIEAEIAKCERVCANCHKDREHRRKQRVDFAPGLLQHVSQNGPARSTSPLLTNPPLGEQTQQGCSRGSEDGCGTSDQLPLSFTGAGAISFGGSES